MTQKTEFLDEYQTAAYGTQNHKWNYRDKVLCAALGLAGEAGEVADYIKKCAFHDQKIDMLKVTKELGDVLWYTAVLAKELGIALSVVASMNLVKLATRHKPGQFNTDYHNLTKQELEAREKAALDPFRKYLPEDVQVEALFRQ